MSDALVKAAAAIRHVLERIHTSPEVGYYMGHCTESFERLVVAYAAIHGISKDEVEKLYRPIFAKNPTTELRERAEQLEREANRLSRRLATECDDAPFTFGPANITPDDFVDRVKELLGVHGGDPERCLKEIAALYDLQDVPYPLLARM